jgi:hypothetical protein
MTKYRIVEVKRPVLTYQHSGAVDWVPDIEYEYEYHIERYIDNGLWGWGNAWVPGYHPNTFPSLKQAERQIEFINESRSSKVVKEY